MRWILSGCVILGVLGCNSVQVKTVRTDTLVAKMRSNILVSDSASPRTMQWLRQHDLDSDFKRKPLAVLLSLSQLVRQKPDREVCFVLSELCHATGRKYER